MVSCMSILFICFHKSLVETENVTKRMKAIEVGVAKRAGVTWFPELTDKSRRLLLILHSCYDQQCRKKYKDISVLQYEKLRRVN